MNPSDCSPQADDEPIPFLLQNGQGDVFVQQGDLGRCHIIPGIYRRCLLHLIMSRINNDIIRVHPALERILGIPQGAVRPAVGLLDYNEKTPVFQGFYCFG